MLMLANVIVPIGAFMGMMLLSHKQKLGFIVFLFVEAAMAYIGVMTQQLGIVITSGIFLLSNCYGYIKWSKT